MDGASTRGMGYPPVELRALRVYGAAPLASMLLSALGTRALLSSHLTTPALLFRAALAKPPFLP